MVGIVTTLRAGHPRDRGSIPCGETLLSPLPKACRLAPRTPPPQQFTQRVFWPSSPEQSSRGVKLPSHRA